MAQAALPSSDKRILSAKFIAMGSVILVATIALVARLLWLQILQHNYYLARSTENSTRVIFLRAPRGLIYDRHGNILAANKQSLSLIAIPKQIENIDDLAARIGRLIDI